MKSSTGDGLKFQTFYFVDWFYVEEYFRICVEDFRLPSRIFGDSADTAGVEGRDGYKQKCHYDVFHIFR